ncbi:MAG: flavodoxin family protein [Bacteroidales bacterium]|nr:flavodoxin family protein [Bacteroidales bacterium]
MKRILVINGSPRPAGNTSFLLKSFIGGAEKNNAKVDLIDSHHINLKYCNGCLRCNLIKRCSISDDEWSELSKKILDSDVLVFASPVYFHHLTAPVKKILDRFRSFVKVQITEQSLEHIPWQEWDKDFVLLLSMGSSSNEDAKPIIDLFKYMTEILGPKNRMHVITATRLGVIKQISLNKEELKVLYKKIELPEEFAEEDYLKNNRILEDCFQLGEKLSAI